METENGNGKRKGKWSSQQYVHSTAINARIGARAASLGVHHRSLGRCKTWTLDSGTHELTDIWTPDKTINDDMTHMPCIQSCPSSVQCTSGGFGD